MTSKTATTTPSIAEFNALYQRWHEGHLDESMPGGESAQQVLDRYLPVVTQLRLRYLDDHAWPGDIVLVSHGAAIRLVAAVLAGVDGGFALEHHLANTECVVLSPDHRRPVELRAMGHHAAAVLSGDRRAPGRGRAAGRRSDGLTDAQTAQTAGTAPLRAHVHPMATQSRLNACPTSGLVQSGFGAFRPRTGHGGSGCRDSAAARLGSPGTANSCPVHSTSRRRIHTGARSQAHPSSCSRSSSMPKWWAISWTTVTVTSSTTSSSVSQMSSSASR